VATRFPFSLRAPSCWGVPRRRPIRRATRRWTWRPRRCGADTLSLIVWATTVGAVIGTESRRPDGTLLAGHGIPTLAGPVRRRLAALRLGRLRPPRPARPDPAVVARGRMRRPGRPAPPRGAGLREAARIVAPNRPPGSGVITMALGHVVMVA
jgi:hypothetical protein